MSGEPDRAALREALDLAGLPAGGEVTVQRIPGGASREAFVVEAGGERCVLRRDPPGADSLTSRAEEFALLGRMRAAGVPVPEPLHLEPAGGRFGTAGFLMAFVDGESLPRRVQRAASGELVEQLAGALARIHGAAPPDGGAALAEHPWRAGIGTWEGIFRRVGEPAPVLELALRWLERNAPPAAPAVTVHGDFRVGNFLVGDGGLRAVIDWEFAHAGDGAEDVGWLCVRSWRFGADDRRAGGLGHLEPFLAAYAAAGGRRISADEVAYWEVLGNVKWAMMCVKQADLHLSGQRRSMELAALGRRRCEIESDLLALIRELG